MDAEVKLLQRSTETSVGASFEEIRRFEIWTQIPSQTTNPALHE